MCCLTPSPHSFPEKAGQRSLALREGAGALSGARPTTGAFRQITRALPCLGEMEPGPKLPVT